MIFGKNKLDSINTDNISYGPTHRFSQQSEICWKILLDLNILWDSFSICIMILESGVFSYF